MLCNWLIKHALALLNSSNLLINPPPISPSPLLLNSVLQFESLKLY